MASTGYNRAAKEGLGDGTYTFLGSTIKIMLCGTATVYTPNPDDDFVDNGGANDPIDAEISVSGYTGGFGGAGRKTLASKTVTVVDGSDRAEYSSAAVTWTALGAGATIDVAILIFETGANDTTSRLLSANDVTNTATNGGDITITPGTGGWFYVSTV